MARLVSRSPGDSKTPVVSRSPVLSRSPVPLRSRGGCGPACHPGIAPALALATAIVLSLAGCGATSPIRAPTTPVAAAFRWTPPASTLPTGDSGNDRFIASTPADDQPRGQWWRAFDDPVLTGLVERAALGNEDLKQAAARYNAARALIGAADAERLPRVDANGSADRVAGYNVPGGPAPRTLLQLGAAASWEADLFGRIARGVDAARLDARSAEALLQNARLTIQGDVATAYLALRALDEERALLDETIDAYRHTVDLTERRHRAGDVGELDVARVSADLAATESDALALDRQRATLESALGILVGQSATNFRLAAAPWSTTLPRIPAGVPATVLARRADVAAAQADVMADQARLGIAETAWLPAIELTTTGGLASSALGDLFHWSARAWGIGALLSLPLFDGGRREAAREQAEARLDASLSRYRGRILVAFKEVEDELAALQFLSSQARAQARAVTAARRATTLSDSRYRHGMVSQLDLLDARRGEVRNRRQELAVRSARFQSTVALVRALGGGWGEVAGVAGVAAAAGSLQPTPRPDLAGGATGVRDGG